MKRPRRGRGIALTDPAVELNDIPDQEQRRWLHTGPVIEGGGAADKVLGGGHREGYTWPSWDAWALVYGRLRDAWLTEHQRLFRSSAPVAERLYAMWESGGDVDAEQARIMTEREADPRVVWP